MWQTAVATAVRNQKANMRAYPWTFTFGHIIDGVYLVLVSYFSYVYLIRGELAGSFSAYAGTDDYLSYSIVGGMLHLLSVSMIMNVSRAVITEWREGTLESLLLTPSGRAGYFAGTALQQLYRCGLELMAVLAVGLWAGLRLNEADWGAAALGTLLYLTSCFAMGVVLGCIMLYTRDTFYVQNTLFTLTSLLCGFQFPRQYLPEPLQRAAEVLPITDSLQLLRSGLLTGAPVQPGRTAVIVALCVVYVLAGLFLHRRIERTVFERF